MKKNNKGFTLVELIVVLVILAILAAILVPTLLGYIDRARSEKDFSTAQTIRVAAQAVIDQAYGAGEVAEVTTPGSPADSEKVAKIENMNGTLSATSITSDTAYNGLTTYKQLVYKLSGVDHSNATDYAFKYVGGIITTGYVKINGHYYYLKDGSWSVYVASDGSGNPPALT